jgi:hypothetical protein
LVCALSGSCLLSTLSSVFAGKCMAWKISLLSLSQLAFLPSAWLPGFLEDISAHLVLGVRVFCQIEASRVRFSVLGAGLLRTPGSAGLLRQRWALRLLRVAPSAARCGRAVHGRLRASAPRAARVNTARSAPARARKASVPQGPFHRHRPGAAAAIAVGRPLPALRSLSLAGRWCCALRLRARLLGSTPVRGFFKTLTGV